MWLKAQLVWLISLPPNAPQFGQNALKNAPQQNFFTPSSIFITFLCINCFRCQIFLKEDSVYFNIDASDISRLITIIMLWIKVAIVFFFKVPLITTNKFKLRGWLLTSASASCCWKKTQITLKNLEVILKRNMAQTTKSQVTLKGSAQMVSEFFNYGINSILYQRGIYPPGSSENLFFVFIKYIFSTIYNIFS